MNPDNEHPLFSTVTVALLIEPARLLSETLVKDAAPDEAVNKVHEFMHLRMHLPVTWLVCPKSLERYGDRLREWRREYGDEIGILEMYLLGKHLAEPGLQEWLEELGLERPEVNNKYGFLCWAEVPEDWQVKIFRHLKQRYDEALGQDTRLIYAANGDASTVRAMKAAGLSLLWGCNWNLYGDCVDSTGMGVPPYPFYAGDIHLKAASSSGEPHVLAFPWGSGDLLNAFCISRQNRIAINRTCLNAHELANRSGVLPKHEFIERFFRQVRENLAWNPFMFVPLQCEGFWLDEGGVCFGQYPTFNSRSTEIFFHLIETAVRYGARIVTHEQFDRWYTERFPKTPEMLLWHEDLLRDSPVSGKDQNFSPMVIACGSRRQSIFLKGSGFNPVRTYRYEPQAVTDDPRLSYPFEREPDVELKVKEWTTPQFGVRIAPDKTEYGTDGWSLTCHDDYPEYETILWHANIPSYIREEDLRHSPEITGIRILREKNLALVSASLTKGDHDMSLRSDLPSRFISMEGPHKSGRRLEFFLHNSGPEVQVASIECHVGPWLRLGGFWYDGEYFETIHQFHHSWYDYRQGIAWIFTAYPLSLTLREGTTRLSIELLGEIEH